jgi:YVTN family beta-propeller protein
MLASVVVATPKLIIGSTIASLTDNSVSASAVAVSPDGKLVASVNPDSDSITLVDTITLRVLAEIPVGGDPRTLSITPNSQIAIVTNHGEATLSVVDLRKFNETSRYSVGAMPYGVVTDGVHIFVTEFALGSVSVIDLATGELLTTIAVSPFPTGLALSGNGQSLYVTHLFSGKITFIDTQTSTVKATASTGADTNLSQFITIAPDGTKAYLPQTRSNATNIALLFDTTVFPIVNVIDLITLRKGDARPLLIRKRITLDTADEPVNMPFAIALSPNGNTLYLSNAGSDDVSVINLTNNRGLAHIKVGSNPRGIAIIPDGSKLFVNNVLDGTLSVIDTTTNTVTNTIVLTKIPLTAPILLGKRLFNSAAEPALATDHWISCATCHFDGMMDARTWLGFPDGPRNTTSLFGVAQTLPIHWSGDLDELQDVELTIRNIQAGSGLIRGEINDSLGSSHTGLSTELDALASYMETIEMPRSPYNSDQIAIGRGQIIFGELACNTCHIPPLYTDHQLHDVGTGDLAKEKNSHGRGVSFDTPSLRGLWLSAPYFHDGSARTLEDVLHTGKTHNSKNKLNTDQFNDLFAFLRAIPYDEP